MNSWRSKWIEKISTTCKVGGDNDDIAANICNDIGNDMGNDIADLERSKEPYHEQYNHK